MTSPTMTDELIEVIARAIQFEGSTYAEKAQAALDAIAEAGYAVVPVKPTAEMLEAMANEGLTVGECQYWRNRYDDLLAAALVGREEK